MGYERWLDSVLDVKSKSGKEWTALCPFHGDTNPSLSVNVDKGLWICYSCGLSGNSRQLAQRFLDLGINTEPEEEIDLDELIAELDAVEKPLYTVLEESYLNLFHDGHPYWRKRLRGRTIRKWQLGYDPLTHSVTIPARTHRGELLGVIRRSLMRGPSNKYKYPKDVDIRTRTLWGAWKVTKPEVVLTEGSVDAMRVWEAGYQAVAQLGSALNKNQVRIMEEIGVQKLVLFYDNDAAGHNAFNRALETKDGLPTALADSPILVYKVRYRPNDSDKVDPGNLPHMRIADMVESARMLS